MKITDEEREAAYELKWLVDEILMGRERAVLYREIYTMVAGLPLGERLHADRFDLAHAAAVKAIAHMQQAFEPVCPACEQEASGPRPN